MMFEFRSQLLFAALTKGSAATAKHAIALPCGRPVGRPILDNLMTNAGGTNGDDSRSN
jgi:hypothetical protein